MQSIDNRVVSKIYGKKRGWVFTPSSFFNLGTKDAVWKALERLTFKGTICRLARGLYYYPKKHPVLGELPASCDLIGKALADRDSIRIQPSGAYAANLLGLTEQVPAKIIFLTDGKGRTINIGNRQIVLIRTAPKNVVAAGRISGLVIQALRYMGKDHVDARMIKKLQNKLSMRDKKQLMKDVQYAPDWIGRIFRKLGE